MHTLHTLTLRAQNMYATYAAKSSCYGIPMHAQCHGNATAATCTTSIAAANVPTISSIE
jgi:hypothetical protein